MGPLEDDRADIRTEPLKLPDKFVWSDIDLEDNDQVNHLKYHLFIINYKTMLYALSSRYYSAPCSLRY